MTTKQRKPNETPRVARVSYIGAASLCLATFWFGFHVAAYCAPFVWWRLAAEVLVNILLAAGWFRAGVAFAGLRRVQRELAELDAECAAHEFGLCDDCGLIHWDPKLPAKDVH